MISPDLSYLLWLHATTVIAPQHSDDLGSSTPEIKCQPKYTAISMAQNDSNKTEMGIKY